MPNIECECQRCGEIFLPSGDERSQVVDGVEYFEHYSTHGPNRAGEYDTECGGFGPIVGEWIATPAAEARIVPRSHDGRVWVLVSDGDSGREVEIFGTRPQTDNHPDNWPRNFALYEGNVNGGDSVCIETRGDGAGE